MPSFAACLIMAVLLTSAAAVALSAQETLGISSVPDSALPNPSGLENDAAVPLSVILRNIDEDFPGIAGVAAYFERKGRLAELQPWLEARVLRGTPDVAIHTALAKVYVDVDIANADNFIATNELYDVDEVGRYCEERDPYLAVLVYANNFWDDDVLRVTNQYSMLDTQARYLYSRVDLDLWARALDPKNRHRQQLLVAVANVEANDENENRVMRHAISSAGLDSGLHDL